MSTLPILRVHDDDDPDIRNLKDKKDGEKRHAALMADYRQIVEKTKDLSAEMRIYQDKLGIYTESDLKSQQETFEDPLLAKIGIGKQAEFDQLKKKDFNYLLPLLIAYKHKLSMLDKHLTERYKQVVRKNNDLENQLEIKDKLIAQIDSKQQETLNIHKIADPLNADYSSMDFISQSDLVHQISTLNESNQRAIDLLDGLSAEESQLIRAISETTREINAAREKHSKLETDTISHRIASVNRNLSILGEKQLELTESNVKLESHKLSLEMELKSLDLSLRGLKRREEACKEELKKAEDETSSLKQNIQRDLQSLEKEEKSLKGNIKLAEDEEKRLKGDVENKKAEIERVRDERVELQRVLDRLKDSAEVLLKKREELLQILAEQKKLAEAADKARATGDLKKLSFDSQQKELEAQYAARLAYLKEENKRRLDTLKRDKEYEIQGKKRLFEELKSQLAELEAQEKQHLDQIEGLRADKARFEQMASNKEGKAKEAELLESRLQHLSASLKQKEQALALVADPRFDVTRIVAEISALQAKKKDLESDKSKVLGELDSLKRENKGLEDQISQAKTSLSSVIETKQGEMRKAQSEVEEKVMRSRREKAEIKQRIAEQYKANEEEKEKAKQWMRAKKEKYEAELIRKLNTAEELRRRMTGGSSAN